MPRFLAVSGSLRAASTNSALLTVTAGHAPAGWRFDIHGGLGRLPIFNPDDEGRRTPQEARRWIEAVSDANGLIVSSPEYAHGIPGGMKNALDWLVSQDAAVGKPAMLVHASHRSVHAREALREVMRTMSFAMFDGPELEIPLLGKTTEQAREILAEPGHVRAMRNTLAAFAAFVEERRASQP